MTLNRAKISQYKIKKIIEHFIKGKIDKTTVVYSDSWRSYDGLVDVGYDKHFEI